MVPGGGPLLATVTVTASDVALLPAASRATAVRAWLPLVDPVVAQATEYGAVVSSAPTLTPSTLNCTPTTPTASEAVAVTVTEPDTEAPAAGAVTDTAGAVTSLPTVTVTPAEVALLPAASRATAVSVWSPLAMPVVAQATE